MKSWQQPGNDPHPSIDASQYFFPIRALNKFHLFFGSHISSLIDPFGQAIRIFDCELKLLSVQLIGDDVFNDVRNRIFVGKMILGHQLWNDLVI
jgi:hypothetical protein